MKKSSFQERYPYVFRLTKELGWLCVFIWLAGVVSADSKLLYLGMALIRALFLASFGLICLDYTLDKVKLSFLIKIYREIAWISVMIYGIGLFGKDDRLFHVGIFCVLSTCLLMFLTMCLNFYRLTRRTI
jgi:hypothetical protein